MWGVRAIRVGVLVGLLAVVGCKSLPTDNAEPAADGSESQPTLGAWGSGGPKDKSGNKPIKAERIHGGIY